jgi:hypothetical protein
MTSRVLVYALAASVAAAPVLVGAQAPTYQGALPANIAAPRRVCSTPDGDMFVADAAGRLHRLTRRGEVVGKVLDGVVAVAAGPGVVFAATRDRTVVQIDARTGRALRKFALGTREVPSGLAFDAAREKLWIAFESGMLQARAADGTALHVVPPANGVYRLAGVTVDAGTVWVAQDRTGAGATLHAYDAETGGLVRSAPVAGLKIVGGVSARPGGGIAVTDFFSGSVRLLDRNAASAGAVGSFGTGAGQLSEPAGVAAMANGDMVVANMDANRLDRFGGGAPLPSCAGDADCDGLPDSWEIANGLNPGLASDAFADLDGDGLNGAEELALGTDPRRRDSDGDGFSDGDELANGFDPTDPNDHRPRIAVAGPSTTGPGLVRLSATVSDPVGNRGACSVAWKKISGASVTLKGATTESASFIARTAGKYVFEASGACGGTAALPVRLEVAVSNVAPRADGGRVVTMAPGGQLDLTGRFSADANGGALAFQWDQLAGPAVLGNAEGEAIRATIQSPGYYVFRVGVKDAAGAEGAAEIPVLVLGDAGAPTAVVSTPVRARAGETVTLDASGSYRAAGATFSWQQVAGPRVAVAAAGERASVVLGEPARYGFEVSIEQDGMTSPPARVDVYAAAAGAELPAARAAAPAVAAVGVPVTLDGTGSSGTGGLSYAWRQVSGPAAGLTREDRAAATVVLFDRGSYEFELVVTDSAGPSLPARVRVDARAAGAPAPVAVASAPGRAAAGDLVLLDGRASTGAMRHRWTQVDGPWVPVEQGAVGWFRPVAPGVYGFELEVDDGAVRSAPVRVNVVVF